MQAEAAEGGCVEMLNSVNENWKNRNKKSLENVKISQQRCKKKERTERTERRGVSRRTS